MVSSSSAGRANGKYGSESLRIDASLRTDVFTGASGMTAAPGKYINADDDHDDTGHAHGREGFAEQHPRCYRIKHVAYGEHRIRNTHVDARERQYPDHYAD